ncbi:unnamed protein product [Adineta ricciae]|uniref:F-box domain-containing protein n=1 Tax=Adineta ricciae TaxID=249248 RepID=A0A814GTI7_ADIRI|nr:unnamed protein product [Adineta ricciae]CAF1000731.1 unnamed protein product [Adineta ricciae]
MLFNDLPSELLLELFSYLHPIDLYLSFLPLFNVRLSKLITQADLSVDLTYISVSNFLLVLRHCLARQIVFLRLTNQYSHGLLISEFFASKHFHSEHFVRLRSLHLDDIIGNEINLLPPCLERLSVKFHKKAEHAAKFYRLALQSTTLRQCYLIGGYAFDSKTCFPISSGTIERLHMAIKSFPQDLFVVLQALPSLIKLKTRIYTQSTTSQIPSVISSSPLIHVNIDLQGTGINLTMLDSQLLSHLPRIQSLICQSYEKSPESVHNLLKLSTRLRRIQFIQKGLSISTNIDEYELGSKNLVVAVQQTTSSRNSRRTLTLHTIPYPDKVIHLPFEYWNTTHHCHNHAIYDRVERVRINLSESFNPCNFSTCQNVKHVTLVCNDDITNDTVSADIVSSFVRLTSVSHLIINSQTAMIDLSSLTSLTSLHSLDITWSQLRPYTFLTNIKSLSLTSECVSWREIQHLMNNLIPQLEHLRMNVTTSDECREILNFLLAPSSTNRLISIKICICQTLSDQIQHDLEPLLLSSQWTEVRWKMDNWYLYIWK